LLRLTSKVRNQIYACVLAGAVGFHRKGVFDSTDADHPYLTVVVSPYWLSLLVCRQVYAEFALLPFKTPYLGFPDFSSLFRSGILTTTQRYAVKAICVESVNVQTSAQQVVDEISRGGEPIFAVLFPNVANVAVIETGLGRPPRLGYHVGLT
jgi:hypothetical protein